MLSDEQIESCGSFSHNRYKFARAIEAAVLDELAKQEPVAYLHHTLPKAISVSDLEGQPEWVQRDWLKGTPLYRHPAPAPEGMAKEKASALRYGAAVIELYDDAEIAAHDHMLSSTECASILEVLAEREEAMIAAAEKEQK